MPDHLPQSRDVRVRLVLTVAIPLAAAALFVRLGVWQLHRLAERRAFNTVLTQRLVSPPVAVTDLSADTALGHYRRVSAAGAFDYSREIVWTGRSRDGDPGVNLLTPMRLAGRDTLVMVDRGWAYSPDATTIDFTRWRERDSATVSGYAETYPSADARGATGGRKVHALDRAAVERAVGLPVAPYLVVQTSDSALHADSIPVRRSVPAMSEGPHKSYAIQWFSFAAIALAGGALLTRQTLRARTSGA